MTSLQTPCTVSPLLVTVGPTLHCLYTQVKPKSIESNHWNDSVEALRGQCDDHVSLFSPQLKENIFPLMI